MKKKVLLLILVVIGFFSYLYFKPTKLVFVGKVSEVDNDCYHDGICKIKVDDKWIITDLGGDPSPEMEEQRGLRGNFGNVSINDKVEVYAKQIDGNTYTLYGNKSYYIKLR